MENLVKVDGQIAPIRRLAVSQQRNELVTISQSEAIGDNLLRKRFSSRFKWPSCKSVSLIPTPSSNSATPLIVMAPPLRAFAYLTIRRSQRFRPHSIPQSLLPPLFWRAITVQAQEPNPSIDLPGTPDIQFAEAPNFSLPSSSGSQHPFAGRQISPFLSDPSSSRSVVTTLPFPPEKVASAPHIQHPFDTHAFVSYLEKADLGRETSRTLMESVRLLITKRGDKTRDDMVGKEDMENVSPRIVISSSFQRSCCHSIICNLRLGCLSLPSRPVRASE